MKFITNRMLYTIFLGLTVKFYALYIFPAKMAAVINERISSNGTVAWKNVSNSTSHI